MIARIVSHFVPLVIVAPTPALALAGHAEAAISVGLSGFLMAIVNLWRVNEERKEMERRRILDRLMK